MPTWVTNVAMSTVCVLAGLVDDSSFGAGQTSGLFPPEIAGSGEVVFQAGDNATLDCFGSAPLQWKWVPEKHSQQVRLVHVQHVKRMRARTHTHRVHTHTNMLERRCLTLIPG